MRRFLPGFTFLVFLMSCTPKTETGDTNLFYPIPAETSGINFLNHVENTQEFNIFSYRNFYNGGGVAIGDINNDGLSDIYFTHNTEQNALYLNKGNFRFEDITSNAGVGGKRKWSTGVVMTDINNDGLLDIYVCNAGYLDGDDQENELFINHGNLKFSEQAADYNLNENGYTTHAAFFDYDLDGDLDAYILNNSFIPANTLNYSNLRDLPASEWPVRDFLKGGGDKLLRNDGASFTDVTTEAGIYCSLIGFGLGVTVGDVNSDYRPDIYISNDFFERDYLYINQGNGTFREEIKNWMEHISLSSMGADMADINNDGYPEIFVTDMLPHEEYRLKTSSMFENYTIYDLKLGRDFYHQYMQNTLQFNNRDNTFSEIAFYSGVAASDWSWGALIFDMDNDGFKDIYVCNAIYQDVVDQDFIDFFANDVMQRMALTGKKEELDSVVNRMPSTPLVNRIFKNGGNLKFSDVSQSWGSGNPSFSNGAAYGDLDNDGDLDLIINNLNQEAFVLENQSNQKGNHFITIILSGPDQNKFAVGSKIVVHANDQLYTSELIPTRGFQSSIDYKNVIGLGLNENPDSVEIFWPDMMRSVILNPVVDTTLVVDYNRVQKAPISHAQPKGSLLFSEVETTLEKHQEDRFSDFYSEGLIIKKLSHEGPCLATGDINGDGTTDIFIGGAANQAAQCFILTSEGMQKLESMAFESNLDFEDTEAVFFDADNDSDLDLWVGSGGNHRTEGHRLLLDRLYKNDGSGNFQLDVVALPQFGFNTSVVVPVDYDEDGDWDIFAGSRAIPGNYGVSPRSFLYENDGNGKFTDVTALKAPDLVSPGLITDAILADITSDEKPELIITGEWMEPQIYLIQNKKFERLSSTLDEFKGWWNTITAEDLDNDGDLDLLLGNIGDNFYLKADSKDPLKLWLADFDNNGTIENIITRSIDGRDMPVPLKKELTEQVVSLKKQNLKHEDYANKAIQDLFDKTEIRNAVVKEARHLKSVIAFNQGDNVFEILDMPAKVQFSCVGDIVCKDLNNDSFIDIIIGGNDYGFIPQFSKLDGSFGHVLLNNGNRNFEYLENKLSGFFLRGQIRELKSIDINSRPHILVGVNNEKPRLFKINN
jgi:hypothetical protein